MGKINSWKGTYDAIRNNVYRKVNEESKKPQERKKMKQIRKGNLEVLKIFCVIAIIMYHYIIHGGMENVTTTLGNKVIIFICSNIGKIASNTFVLITGFFLFKFKFKIEKILKIIVELFFYSILVNLIIVVILKEPTYLNYLIYSFTPIFFKVHWFAVAYIGMYFLIPFIKPALDKLAKEDYLIILVVLGTVLSIIPSIISVLYGINSIEPFGESITLLYIAMIGGYISKFNLCIFKKKKYNLIAIVLSFIFFSLINQLRTTNSVFVIILSILIIDLFLKLNVKNNKLINFFSSSSLGVLLLHDNIFFNKIMWIKIFNTQAYYYVSAFKLLLHIVLCVLTIYIIGSVIDYIRRNTMEVLLSKWLDNNDVLNKINTIFNFEK